MRTCYEHFAFDFFWAGVGRGCEHPRPVRRSPSKARDGGSGIQGRRGVRRGGGGEEGEEGGERGGGAGGGRVGGGRDEEENEGGKEEEGGGGKGVGEHDIK